MILGMRILYTECDRPGLKKRITFTAYYWRKRRAKSISKLKHQNGKRQPAIEGTAVEKERRFLQAPKFAVAEGVVNDVDEDVDE